MIIDDDLNNALQKTPSDMRQTIFTADHHFITSARSSFLLLNNELNILWRGGHVFEACNEANNLNDFLINLDLNDESIDTAITTLKSLEPGDGIFQAIELKSNSNSFFSLISKRRPAVDSGYIQLTLSNITPVFKAQDTESQKMKVILKKLEKLQLYSRDKYILTDFIKKSVVDLRDSTSLETDAKQLTNEIQQMIEHIITVLKEVSDMDFQKNTTHRNEYEHPDAYLSRLEIINSTAPEDARTVNTKLSWDEYMNSIEDKLAILSKNDEIQYRQEIKEIRYRRDFLRYAQPTILFSPDGQKVFRISVDSPVIYQTLEKFITDINGCNIQQDNMDNVIILRNYLKEAHIKSTSGTVWMQGERYIILAGPIKAKDGWQASLTPIVDNHIMPNSRVTLHDLKTGLNHLQFINFIDSIETLDKFTPFINDGLKIIRKQLKNMEAIRDKVKLNDDDKTNVSMLIDSLNNMALLQNQLSVEIKPDKSCTTQDFSINASPNKFFIAFQQMIENAQQHNANSIIFELSCDYPQLYIYIHDNGNGMPTNVLQQLRRNIELGLTGFTTRSDGTGNGVIGIFNTFLSLKDAKVNIDSKEGEGVSYTIKLPLNFSSHQSNLTINS